MARFTVVYLNSRNVACSRKVESKNEKSARERVIKLEGLFGNKVNKIVKVTESK